MGSISYSQREMVISKAPQKRLSLITVSYIFFSPHWENKILVLLNKAMNHVLSTS